MRHPNIVQLFEYLQTKTHHLFFMELCPGGDMLHYVRKRRRLDEDTARHFFKQIMKGIAYLHTRRIVHRDIKLENILISNTGAVKLADFGVSAFIGLAEHERVMFEGCGTPAYMAPEVVRVGNYLMNKAKRAKGSLNKSKARVDEPSFVYMDDDEPPPYNKACDLWSAGVVLYAMLYGQLPFRGFSVREIKEKVLEGQVIHKYYVSK